MTEQVRKRIVNTIENWILKNGNMPLRLLKMILRNAGIPAEAFEKVQPKSWISTQFPEFEIIGTCGYEHIIIVDKTLLILKAAVSKEGRFLLCSISPLLNSEGIDWKSLANGKKIYEWILDSYPQAFNISDDKVWLYLKDPIPQKTVTTPDQITRT